MRREACLSFGWIQTVLIFKKIFADEKKTFILYCQSAWRSVLATKTLMDMGMTNVKQFEDGFSGWKKAGGPIANKTKK